MERIEFKTFRIYDFECMYKCEYVCVCLCHLVLVLICTYLGAHLELLYGIGNHTGGLWYCSARNARCQLLGRRDLGLGDALPSGWYLYAHSAESKKKSSCMSTRVVDGNNNAHTHTHSDTLGHSQEPALPPARQMSSAHSHIQQLAPSAAYGYV